MNDTIAKMAGATAGGWVLSLSDVEIMARIISLLVPVALSILIYRQKMKNLRNDSKPKSNAPGADSPGSSDDHLPGSR